MLVGPQVLDDCPSFDRLAADLRLPLTARRPYLGTYGRAYPEWQPWVIAVPGAGGEWAAAAALARRRRSGLTQIVGLGHGVADQARLPARDHPAAQALSAAIVRALGGIRGPWTLRLEQLPAGDPVAVDLAGRLPGARLAPGVGLPRMDLSPAAGSPGSPGSAGGAGAAGSPGWAAAPAGRLPERYLDRKFRQQVNAARRRFAAAGVEPRIDYLHTPAEVAPLLDDLLAVRRSRDRAALYRQELADDRRARWWRTALLAFADHGELELAVLDVGPGAPAAYVAALLDPPSYRLWDGRINEEWQGQWPGQLIYGEVLARAIRDDRWAEIDYGRGETSFKLRTANEVMPTHEVLAWSSPAVRRATETPRAARQRLRAWKDTNPTLDGAWRAVKSRLRSPPGW